MQEGRDGSRCRHRVRKPEVERKLRALGQRAEKDQDQRRQVERAGPDRAAGFQHPIEVVAAGDMAEQQYAEEEAQAARCRDRERHASAVARGGIVMPVADEQEREQAGEFPEKHQLDEIARQHDAEHRSHEREEERKEARNRILGRHVVARIKHDQKADPGHQDGEQPRKTVEPQGYVEAQLGNPWQNEANDAPLANRRVKHDGDDDPEQGRGAGESGRRIVRFEGKERSQQACGEGCRNNDKQEDAIPHRDRVTFRNSECRLRDDCAMSPFMVDFSHSTQGFSARDFVTGAMPGRSRAARLDAGTAG